MSDRLLRTRELADLFNVAPCTIIDWAASGKIPATAVVRLGGTTRGRLRFRESAIDQLLEDWSGAYPDGQLESNPG
jgi:excisionase family DNA binding protein